LYNDTNFIAIGIVLILFSYKVEASKFIYSKKIALTVLKN